MSKKRKLALGCLVIVPAACLLLTLAVFLSNLGLPTRSKQVDVLSAQDRYQAAEYRHLRAALGDSVWPGYGSQPAPVMLFNEQRLFLLGMADPADGWVKVPDPASRGTAWQPVSGEEFDGLPVYSQVTADPAKDVGAFTVRVGDQYVACLTTLEAMRIGMVEAVRGDLPDFLKPIFPYRIFPLAMINNEWHILGLAHEGFHAYQGSLAPARLDAAELAERNLAKTYRAQVDSMLDGWKNEVSLLHQALKSTDDAQTRDLARQFLAQREQRRADARLDATLAQYERDREWLEGLAKYTELELWRAGRDAADYTPLPVPAGVKDVNDYQGFQQYYNEQVRLVGTQDPSGEQVFYYTGWAQAELLDRFSPGWKERILNDDASLEDLLREALR